jgi:hypothetical protein
MVTPELSTRGYFAEVGQILVTVNFAGVKFKNHKISQTLCPILTWLLDN